MFTNYAKTTEENRDRMRKGLNEPGSIDTDVARFVSTDQDFLSETGIFNKGGFEKFDVIDGRIIGTFLDASGNLSAQATNLMLLKYSSEWAINPN